MVAEISPFKANGKIFAPPSKSAAQRYLICAALCRGKTIIKNVGNADDINATANCLIALGAKINFTGGNAEVIGLSNGEKTVKLDFNESGFAARVILPVACATGASGRYTVSGKLGERLLKTDFSALKNGGATITGDSFGGRLTVGKYTVNRADGSQLVSGLLIALAALNGVSKIKLVGESVSEGYISLTLSALEKFGVKTIFAGDEITVYGGTYKSPKVIAAEGDFSAAANFLALGAIGGKITVSGLNKNGKQPDRAVIDILKDFGANISVGEDCVTAEKNQLKGIEFSCKNNPDLAPIAAVVGAYAHGETVIKDTDRLKNKESDRLAAIIKMLGAAGIETRLNGDTLIITGGKPRGGAFAAARDHRIVMAEAVLASAARGKSVIDHAESVSKSYPEFFAALKATGGGVYEQI